MPFRLISLLCLLAILFHSSPGRADPLDDDEERPQHRISLFISPLALFKARTLEVGAEFKFRPKVSFAAFGNVGHPGYLVLGLAGQVRRYLIGDFEHGLNIGGEVNFISGSLQTSSLVISTTGLGLGAFVGYKYVARFGVTVDLNAGYEVYGIGRSSSSSELVPSGSAVLSGMLLRVNFGWSF